MACITPYSTALPLPEPITKTWTESELKCMGVGMTLTEWKAYWTDTAHVPCDVVFNRLLYPPGETKRAFNPVGFRQATDDFDYMFSQYFGPGGAPDGKGGHQLTLPGLPGYDSFQEILLNACTLPQFAIQGVCQAAAEKMCLKCERDEAIASAPVLRLCGCNVFSLNPVAYEELPRECDPLCAQALVSKIRDRTSGEVGQCIANVCVINDVSIAAARSTIGGINFTQVCPQCSQAQQCKCIVDASIPNAEVVGLVDPVIFRQYCGTDSMCLTIDKDTQTSIPVPCDIAIAPLQPRTFDYKIPVWVWIVGLILLIIGILVLIAAASDPRPKVAVTTSPLATTPPTGGYVPSPLPPGAARSSVAFRR